MSRAPPQGSAAGLGGPPLALLYRDRPGPVLRATLAAVWTVGLLPALFGLWLAGRFAAVHLVAGGLMALATLVGMAAGLRLVRFVSDRAVRHAILWWSALGSVVALARSLVG